MFIQPIWSSLMYLIQTSTGMSKFNIYPHPPFFTGFGITLDGPKMVKMEFSRCYHIYEVFGPLCQFIQEKWSKTERILEKWLFFSWKVCTPQRVTPDMVTRGVDFQKKGKYLYSVISDLSKHQIYTSFKMKCDTISS